MALTRITKYLILYTVLSVSLLAWSIYDSLKITTNFLSLISELTDGYKLSIFVNFLFFSYFVVGKLIIMIVFGELRLIESEHLLEKLPMLVINLLLVVSNDDNIIFNCLLLHTTIFLKVFHIILIDRVDLVHLRVVNNSNNGSLGVLSIITKYTNSLYFWLISITFFIDFSIAKFLAYDVFQGVNSVVCLLIGFQFAVQGVEGLGYYTKLLLNIYELIVYRNGNNDILHLDGEDDDDDDKVWENKPYYSKSIDIGSASLKAISHLACIYLLTFHSSSMPISMFQGTYSSIKQIVHEVKQLLSFIESSKRLDSQLKNATKQELQESDNLCIICREDMYCIEDYEEIYNKKMPLRKYPKKLRCNHILHMGCLKDWLERSENCPLCRRNVFKPPAETPSNTTVPPEANNNEIINDHIIIPENNEPIAPPITATGASTNNFNNNPVVRYPPSPLTVNLGPILSIIPLDWSILPINDLGDGSFDLSLSQYDRANLRIIDNTDVYQLTTF